MNLYRRFLAGRSVFLRLSLLFTIAVIPLYAIVFGTIWYISREIVNEIQRTVDDRMTFYLDNVNREITNIQQQLVTFSVDNEMNHLPIKEQGSPFKDYLAYRDIMRRLQNLYLSSRYLNNAFIVYPQLDYELSISTDSRHIDRVREMFPTGRTDYRLHSYNDADTIVYLIPSMDNSFVVGAEIRQDRIVRDIKEIKTSYPFGFILTEPKSGRLLGGTAVEPLDALILAAYREGKVHGDYVVLDNVRYLVKSPNISDENFTFITYIEKKMILKDLRSVEDGHYEIVLHYSKDDEFGYVYRRFNNMAAQIKNLIQEVYMRKIQVQEMELQRLQSHINPHFLYNSLYISYRMAKAGETENVAKMCKYLGDYFRFITYFANNEVSVKDELGFVKTYLNIQKLRHRNRLEFEVKEAEDCAEQRIPVLLLQPIVENSVLYGIDDSDTQIRIEVSAAKKEGCIELIVADNGPGMSKESLKELYERLSRQERPRSHGYGLWNIYWRLRYAYEDRGILNIENREGGGLLVHISVPAEKMEEKTSGEGGNPPCTAY